MKKISILEKSRAPSRIEFSEGLVGWTTAWRDALRVRGCRIAPGVLRQVLFGGLLRDGETKLPQHEVRDGVAPVEVSRGARLVHVHTAITGLAGRLTLLRILDASQNFLAQRGVELHVTARSRHENVTVLDVSVGLVTEQRHNSLLSMCSLTLSKHHAWISHYPSITYHMRQGHVLDGYIGNTL